MKYARLSLNDLKDLEKEFIEFLVLNGIAADDWEQMKEKDMAKADQIIDQFSDVIWEGVLRKSEMLEFRRKDFLTVCRVRENELLTMVIKAPNSGKDFTKEEDIKSVLQEIDEYEITLRKDLITKSAAEQLFEFIKLGFYITKDTDYRKLFDEKGQETLF